MWTGYFPLIEHNRRSAFSFVKALYEKGEKWEEDHEYVSLAATSKRCTPLFACNILMFTKDDA